MYGTADARTFRVGDRVRVREDYPTGHFRTPVYVRGRVGTVVAFRGIFGDPETLAYRLEGPDRPLYAVRFQRCHLWSDGRGPRSDSVEVEIYGHWLSHAEEV